MKLREPVTVVIGVLAALYWVFTDVTAEEPPKACAKAVVVDGATYTDWRPEYCEVFDHEA